MPGSWRSTATVAAASLAVGFALACGLGVGRIGSLKAEGVTPGAPGLIAMTDTQGGTTSLLYLIDPRSQSFAIYRVDLLKGTVKLEAARQFRGDLRLSEYNNLPPEVASVEAMVSPGAARSTR